MIVVNIFCIYYTINISMYAVSVFDLIIILLIHAVICAEERVVLVNGRLQQFGYGAYSEATIIARRMEFDLKEEYPHGQSLLHYAAYEDEPAGKFICLNCCIYNRLES